MWPAVARAHTNDGSVFFFGVGLAGFVLGLIASARFSNPTTKPWVLGGGFVVMWVVLTLIAEGGDLFDRIMRMMLGMIYIVPIPFVVGLVLGLGARRLSQGRS
jgi:hypothetical protein